jgi:hypothetical protein
MPRNAASRRLVGGALACLCACARSDPGPQALAPVDPAQLRLTSGTMERKSATTFSIEDPSFRAELGDAPRSSAEIAFVYRGPTRRDAPLASGELRRQVGLKLRAKDTCNVVYVMWHIEPSRGIEVSVKSNPGQASHQECGDRGYTFIKPTWVGDDVSDIRTGSRHAIAATIAGSTLRVVADGRPAWVGDLPPQAFRSNGPVGVRSDNGAFDVELQASRAEPEDR